MSWKTTTLHGKTVPSWRWIIAFHAMWLVGGVIVGAAGTVVALAVLR